MKKEVYEMIKRLYDKTITRFNSTVVNDTADFRLLRKKEILEYLLTRIEEDTVKSNSYDAR